MSNELHILLTFNDTDLLQMNSPGAEFLLRSREKTLKNDPGRKKEFDEASNNSLNWLDPEVFKNKSEEGFSCFNEDENLATRRAVWLFILRKQLNSRRFLIFRSFDNAFFKALEDDNKQKAILELFTLPNDKETETRLSEELLSWYLFPNGKIQKDTRFATKFCEVFTNHLIELVSDDGKYKGQVTILKRYVMQQKEGFSKETIANLETLINKTGVEKGEEKNKLTNPPNFFQKAWMWIRKTFAGQVHYYYHLQESSNTSEEVVDDDTNNGSEFSSSSIEENENSKNYSENEIQNGTVKISTDVKDESATDIYNQSINFSTDIDERDGSNNQVVGEVFDEKKNEASPKKKVVDNNDKNSLGKNRNSVFNSIFSFNWCPSCSDQENTMKNKR